MSSTSDSKRSAVSHLSPSKLGWKSPSMLLMTDGKTPSEMVGKAPSGMWNFTLMSLKVDSSSLKLVSQPPSTLDFLGWGSGGRGTFMSPMFIVIAVPGLPDAEVEDSSVTFRPGDPFEMQQPWGGTCGCHARWEDSGARAALVLEKRLAHGGLEAALLERFEVTEAGRLAVSTTLVGKGSVTVALDSASDLDLLQRSVDPKSSRLTREVKLSNGEMVMRSGRLVSHTAAELAAVQLPESTMPRGDRESIFEVFEASFDGVASVVHAVKVQGASDLQPRTVGAMFGHALFGMARGSCKIMECLLSRPRLRGNYSTVSQCGEWDGQWSFVLMAAACILIGIETHAATNAILRKFQGEMLGDFDDGQMQTERMPSHLFRTKAKASGAPMAYWHGNPEADVFANGGAATHLGMLHRGRIRQNR
ncbi:unnamed protein product [Prorocentrum cordatum]|uniref:Uncharacterized protein n=1 Tax=Prorocentrum cordatum TaxID=2364126 RepID=A0ABN9VKN7_9DINO|nr:unnamed protein product [Polarella glacialis]